MRATRLPLVLSPHLPEAAARQNIASYAHLHGVVLTRKHAPVDAMAPTTLCRILREAIEATTEGGRERAEMVVRSIAARIGEAGGDPLPVPQVALDVLRRLTLAARLATATPGRSSAPSVSDRRGKPAHGLGHHKSATRKRATDNGASRSWT